jgi:hypothetical protein
MEEIIKVEVEEQVLLEQMLHQVVEQVDQDQM